MTQLKNGLSFSIITAVILIWLQSCANMAAPTGGPRDSLPPILLRASPPDSTLNLKGGKETRIVFDFDEYIELDNIQQNLIVSPTLKGTPFVTRKLRTVTVRIKDTLDENTTYTLDFGNGIKDLNEGNPFKNFRYTFSTGNYLDSLSLSGKITLAEDGKTDTTLMVMLHRNLDDSAVVKEKPRYYTRVNNKGAFTFRNLPPGQFKLYALKDESGMGRYMKPDQLFAFSDSIINTAASNEDIELFAYVEEKEDKKDKPKATKPGAKPQLTKKDSTLRFQPNLDGEQMDLLKALTLTFPRPIANFDSTKLQLTDSTYKPVTGYTYSLDTSRTILTLTYAWPAETGFNLLSTEGSVIDSLGGSLPTDTLTFTTKRKRDYGSLRLRFTNYNAGGTPLVLQLVANNEVKAAIPVSAGVVYRELFPPGEYELRILIDENNNGKWDPGSFFGGRKQPEKVRPYEKKLSVKANWDNELSVEL